MGINTPIICNEIVYARFVFFIFRRLLPLFERHILGIYLLVEKYLCTFLKTLLAFGCQVSACAVLGTLGFHLGMSCEIILQRVSHVGSLRDDTHSRRTVAYDAAHQEWIVRTAEHYGIDVGILKHQLVDAFLYEVVGTGRISLVRLDYGCPERTGLSGYLHIGCLFFYFKLIAATAYGALCGENADMTCSGQLGDAFGCRAYDTEHTAVRTEFWQHAMLY